ncbi:MAG: LemA family protein [Bacteroidales bacterium]|nr:LemA family protein [Bacteroidales bacterium]
MITAIIIIVVVALVALWLIGAQRKLVSADELCKNALSQIGVQQNSRWDALTALAELTKGYSEHEYKTLMDVIAQRTAIGRNSTAADVAAQEGRIAEAMRQINVVAEQYPALKANETYVKTMDEVGRYENQVRLSRMTYNDTVTKFNRMVRMFPDSIAAAIFGFQAKDYLAEPAGKTEMPSMK